MQDVLVNILDSLDLILNEVSVGFVSNYMIVELDQSLDNVVVLSLDNQSESWREAGAKLRDVDDVEDVNMSRKHVDSLSYCLDTHECEILL